MSRQAHGAHGVVSCYSPERWISFSIFLPPAKVRDANVGGCGDTRTGNDVAAPDPDDDRGSERRKKRKRRRSKGKQQPPTPHIIVNLPSSSDEVEPVGECSKRDSSSSLGGTRHSSLRESLLTVLGKLVVWRGTSRYRQTPTSSSVPPNTPPATECIGRSSAFFSSGESILRIRSSIKGCREDVRFGTSSVLNPLIRLYRSIFSNSSNHTEYRRIAFSTTEKVLPIETDELRVVRLSFIIMFWTVITIFWRTDKLKKHSLSVSLSFSLFPSHAISLSNSLFYIPFIIDSALATRDVIPAFAS